MRFSPGGTVTPVVQILAAESISFVPANISSETNPVEGLSMEELPVQRPVCPGVAV